MNHEIIKNYRNNNTLRQSFNELAIETFGLNFENWYQNGYWGEKYIPYSIVIDGAVRANVSVNLIDCTLNGKTKQYIQLGTVMTQSAHRKKGYCKALMEAILHDYAMCDGFFLYANDSVLDLYPKFGFQRLQEYRFRCKNNYNSEPCAKIVPMSNKVEWASFLTEKNERSSNGVLQLDTDGLLMFYLTQFMQNNVYHIEALDAYVIAEVDGDTLVLYDVFSKAPIDMEEVCHSFGSSITQVKFKFTPNETNLLEQYEHQKNDTTFFVRGNNLMQDMREILSFPDIVQA